MGFKINARGESVPTTLADDLAALAAAGYAWAPCFSESLLPRMVTVGELAFDPAPVADDDLDIIGWEHWQDHGGEAGCGS